MQGPRDPASVGPTALALRIKDLSRNSGLSLDGATLTLVADAAAWRSARDSVSPPPGLQDVSSFWPRGLPALPDELLDLQRAWLDQASSDDLESYVPMLVRCATGRPEDAQLVSSETMVDIVVAALTSRVHAHREGVEVVIYDPVCGTGGTLVAAGQALQGTAISVALYGQDVNSWAAFVAGCALWVGGWRGRTTSANSLIADAMPHLRCDYAVAEPPFGLAWHDMADGVRAQRDSGLFPGGLPQLSDSTLLFVQHVVGKLRGEVEGGGRAVVLTAPSTLRSPGGDKIRRWLLEQDLLEAVIGLPEGMAAMTGIRLNALILTNLRSPHRRGKVQLVDLRGSYENQPRSSLSRRRLRPDALDSLRHALSTVKPGPISRTVPAERFLYRNLTVASGWRDGTERIWQIPLSVADEPESFLARHVQSPPSRVVETAEAKVCRIDLDEVINRDTAHVAEWIRERNWPVSRMAAVANGLWYVRSSSADNRDEAIAALPPGDFLMLPVEAIRRAVHGDPTQDAPDGRFLAFMLDEELSSDFLVGYLNSRNGVLARRATLDVVGGGPSPRTISQTGVEALLSALVIPVPDLATQRRLVEADSAVQAAIALASRTADELWRSPEQSAELVRRVAAVGKRQSLGEWAQELPYPLATALWACEAQKANAHAANRQLFHFWEATAEFVGTVLLSALFQDESLRDHEMRSLRATLASQALSMHRATLGVWLIVTQRLGRRFRDMLDSDDADERARVDALFAGAPDDLVRALCSAELAAILGRVIQRRNEWSGHGGAITDHALKEQNGWLLEQIKAMRTLIDGEWVDAPLVRAGHCDYEDGVFAHEVERVMGLNTPFLTQTVSVGTPMTKGRLYLVTDGAQRALELQPFVQLRSSPASAQYSCYFYNRLEGEEARLVSYHLGAEGELLERSPGLWALVAGFDPATSRESPETS